MKITRHTEETFCNYDDKGRLVFKQIVITEEYAPDEEEQENPAEEGAGQRRLSLVPRSGKEKNACE